MSNPSTQTENRLAQETSPYLLQHKHNPVDWWAWGPDALAEAQRLNKPILISIGYAACHWCHVMAHESFEDDGTARVMNELFINIKVDREERPDIDQIYMNALHALGEQGGWPLTMFLTPKGEPVWGGTYFPKESRYGRAAFVDVLREIARLFHDEPQRITQNRDALMNHLAKKARPEGKVTVGSAELDKAATAIANAFDPVNGGLRGAPKFPQCSILDMLWRAGLRHHDRRFFETVEHSLERMSQGGIYDHLGGGYSRYAVDERWLVPHFEKMLYDNAQILELLGLAYARSGNPLFYERARETVGWLERDMIAPGGGFCASLDADSEGEEGKYYVWTRREIEQALGSEDGSFFAAQYDVSPGGNFEGKNILNRLKDMPRSTEGEIRLAMLRGKLHKIREGRVRPGLDDKVLADWNGLMIAGLVHAATAFGEPRWIDLARTAFAFVATNMSRGDRLGHSFRDGRLLFPGLASDFAAMTRAALALHEATGDGVCLDRALRWQRALDAHYRDPDGGYFLTANDAQGLVLRPQSTMDDATPNPQGLIAENLIRLAVVTGGDTWREQADLVFDALLPAAAQNMFAHAGVLNALDLRLRTAEIVVTGHGDGAERLVTTALKLPYLSRVVLRAPNAEALPAQHPARNKVAASSQPAAFVCIGSSCSLPITDPAGLKVIFGG
jgi:uncharacterized protein YyaL (SSP411 family)